MSKLGSNWQGPPNWKAQNIPVGSWAHMSAGQGSNGISSSGAYSRFRSFAERYLIERASTFTKGKEIEEGWQCIQDAKKLYGMMAAADADADANQAKGVNIEAQIKLQMAALAAAKVAGLKQQAPAKPTQSAPGNPYNSGQSLTAGPTSHSYPDTQEECSQLINGIMQAGDRPPRDLIRKFYDLVKGPKHA